MNSFNLQFMSLSNFKEIVFFGYWHIISRIVYIFINLTCPHSIICNGMIIFTIWNIWFLFTVKKIWYIYSSIHILEIIVFHGYLFSCLGIILIETAWHLPTFTSMYIVSVSPQGQVFIGTVGFQAETTEPLQKINTCVSVLKKFRWAPKVM